MVRLRFIDSNHCPGSCMVILTGPLGTVLNTGDFRYSGVKMIKEIGAHRIDYMILDNTYCNPKVKVPT
jgi:Cft2 family RNA processing exonuclease